MLPADPRFDEGERAPLAVVMSSPTTLSSRWRIRAKLFRDHAEESVARAYEKCATELDEALQEREDRLLNLQEAAALNDERDHRMDPRGSTHCPGATMQLLFRQRRLR